MKRVLVKLAVFTVRGGRLEALLVRYPGNRWALPGRELGQEAGLDRAAMAALREQTGVGDAFIEQLYTFDGPPDEVTTAYLGLIAAEGHPLAPGPEVVEVRWFPHDDLPPVQAVDLEVLRIGEGRLRAKTAYAPIALQLLPGCFTLGQLQEVYEAVLGIPLDTRNFRRDVLAAGVVEPVGQVRSDGRGRPAQLYRSADGDFAVLARERRIARAIARPPGASSRERR
jgi:8-oxo-dGTP diphosphatase